MLLTLYISPKPPSLITPTMYTTTIPMIMMANCIVSVQRTAFMPPLNQNKPSSCIHVLWYQGVDAWWSIWRSTFCYLFSLSQNALMIFQERSAVFGVLCLWLCKHCPPNFAWMKFYLVFAPNRSYKKFMGSHIDPVVSSDIMTGQWLTFVGIRPYTWAPGKQWPDFIKLSILQLCQRFLGRQIVLFCAKMLCGWLWSFAIDLYWWTAY